MGVNGLKVSGHLVVGSTIFGMLKETGAVPPPAIEALEGFASLTTDNTLRYTKKLRKKRKGAIPTLEKEMKELSKNFKRGTPKEIQEKITQVMTASKGLGKMEGRGLPYKWELDVEMRKFAPFTLMQSLLEM